MHSAGILKAAIVPLFAVVALAALFDAVWLAVGSLVMLIATVRLQRLQEAKRLHGYRRRRRRRAR